MPYFEWGKLKENSSFETTLTIRIYKRICVIKIFAYFVNLADRWFSTESELTLTETPKKSILDKGTTQFSKSAKNIVDCFFQISPYFYLKEHFSDLDSSGCFNVLKKGKYCCYTVEAPFLRVTFSENGTKKTSQTRI